MVKDFFYMLILGFIDPGSGEEVTSCTHAVIPLEPGARRSALLAQLIKDMQAAGSIPLQVSVLDFDVWPDQVC